VIFDPSSERGAHALARLTTDKVAWLTTVTAAGQPQSMPIWFLWDEGELFVYSDRRAHRNANLAGNPKVSFHLADIAGGDIVMIEGEAWIDPDAPGVPDHPAYLAKYGSSIDATLGGPARMAEIYRVAIRIRPTRGIAIPG
jgi:PPOX class probable F420-dependent enzyme